MAAPGETVKLTDLLRVSRSLRVNFVDAGLCSVHLLTVTCFNFKLSLLRSRGKHLLFPAAAALLFLFVSVIWPGVSLQWSGDQVMVLFFFNHSWNSLIKFWPRFFWFFFETLEWNSLALCVSVALSATISLSRANAGYVFFKTFCAFTLEAL